MPQQNVDSRDLTSVFAFKAREIDQPSVIAGKDNVPLYSILIEHPAFRTGCNRPYFKEERFILPDDYEICFWSQDPQAFQIYKDKDDIDQLVLETSHGWQGYNRTISFRGVGLSLDFHGEKREDKLSLIFNGEGQRVYEEFTNYMTPYLRDAKFNLTESIQFEPRIILAEREDVKQTNKARQTFWDSVQRRNLHILRTNDIAVRSLTLYQELRTNGEGIVRADRDIATIHYNGKVTWHYDQCPFDKRANDVLVNQYARRVQQKSCEMA